MAVAHVQTGKTINNTAAASQTTGALTFTAGGNAIITIMAFNTGVVVPVPTTAKLDNTTTMTLGVDSTNINTSSNFNMRVLQYVTENVTGASHSVTIAWPATIPSNCTYFLTEYSGGATSSSGDGSGSHGSGVSTAAASGNATSTNSNDFWLAATTSLPPANPGHFTRVGSFTIPANGTETNSSANLCGGIEYLENPGATSENGQFTVDSGDWVCVVMAYKAGASGPVGYAIPWYKL